jgi:hypothetical protein
MLCHDLASAAVSYTNGGYADNPDLQHQYSSEWTNFDTACSLEDVHARFSVHPYHGDTFPPLHSNLMNSQSNTAPPNWIPASAS